MEKQILINRLRHNKLIRVLLWPEVTLLRIYRNRAYATSSDSEYMRNLKGIHKGERCFVIGNGSSLTPEDLEQLKGEVSFGTNRIFYIFEKTTWRPTYYLAIDNDVLGREINEIKEQNLPIKLLNLKAKKYGRTEKDNIYYINIFGKFHISRDNIKQESFSENVESYFSETCSVTCTSIELAAYMGFKEIYLIGMDHKYRYMVVDGKKVEDKSVKTYFKEMKHGDGVAIAYIDNLEKSYSVCKKYCEEHGIKIYNATRGGYLDVFERISIDEVIRTIHK